MVPLQVLSRPPTIRLIHTSFWHSTNGHKNLMADSGSAERFITKTFFKGYPHWMGETTDGWSIPKLGATKFTRTCFITQQYEGNLYAYDSYLRQLQRCIRYHDMVGCWWTEYQTCTCHWKLVVNRVLGPVGEQSSPSTTKPWWLISWM